MYVVVNVHVYCLFENKFKTQISQSNYKTFDEGWICFLAWLNPSSNIGRGEGVRKSISKMR